MHAMMTTASPRTSRGALRGWPLFIILSLLFHLSLVLLLDHLASSPAALTTTPSPLAIHIVKPSPHAAASARATPVQPPAAKTATTPAPKPVPPAAKPPAAAAAAAPRTAAPVLAEPPPPDEFEGGTGQRVLDMFPDAGGPIAPPRDEPGSELTPRMQIETLIRTRFAEHFLYPPLAQRYGWQGDVLLRFRVETNGTINTIEVTRSSGYAVLDEAAIDSLRAIGHLEFAAEMQLQQRLVLYMPVIYRLAQ